jgi:Secretion system C-terminal sorting domain
MKTTLLFVIQLVAITVLNAQINSTNINEILIGPGSLSVDLNNDGLNDFTFEILTLSPNVLAARAVTLNSSEFLDDSTFGYPNALDEGDLVNGYFNNGNGVLGTFNNAGQFNGMGDKFLGVKINSSGNDLIGWIKLNCNANNDTLKIISAGYNTLAQEPITAGETGAVSSIEENSSESAVLVYPNPFETSAIIQLPIEYEKAQIILCDGKGRFVTSLYNFAGSQIVLNRGELATGVYFLVVSTKGLSPLVKRIVLVD